MFLLVNLKKILPGGEEIWFKVLRVVSFGFLIRKGQLVDNFSKDKD